MLTDEEREQLNCDCHRMPVLATYPLQRRHRDTCFAPVVESIIAARVRAARAQELRDTAATLDSDSHAQVSYRCVAQGLRDRANHIESSPTG